MRLAVLALALVVASGCAATSKNPAASNAVELPTYATGDAYPEALITGTLQRQGPCVTLHEGQDYLLIWPPGTTATLEEAGVVVTEPNGQSFSEQQRVTLGGGEYSEADFPRSIAGLPAGCRGYVFWLVTPPGN